MLGGAALAHPLVRAVPGVGRLRWDQIALRGVGAVAVHALLAAVQQVGQRCIISAEAIYEPCYESGRAVRWRIFQDGDVPLGIVGIYTTWKLPEGRHLHSMSMLTVNADGHTLMSRMHRPDDEKRMVVILGRDEYLPSSACVFVDHADCVTLTVPSFTVAKALVRSIAPVSRYRQRAPLLRILKISMSSLDCCL